MLKVPIPFELVGVKPVALKDNVSPVLIAIVEVPTGNDFQESMPFTQYIQSETDRLAVKPSSNASIVRNCLTSIRPGANLTPINALLLIIIRLL
jgi:hypothetical protein